MRRVLLLLILGLVFSPLLVFSAEREQHVIIRDGYTVPDGKMLLIDDISMQCTVHLSEPGQVDSINTPTVNALLKIGTPEASKCRENLEEGVCPAQFYSIGVGTSEVTLYGFGGCDGYCPLESIVGRSTDLAAYGGDKLEGYCRWGYDPATDGPDLFLGSRILTGIGRLVDAPNK